MTRRAVSTTIPHGLGITDDELVDSLQERREALRRIKEDVDMIELFLDLSPEHRLEMYELMRSMVAMNRLQRQRALN